ncbi:unnamed protein product, partial [Ostreobium quekettii]
METDGAQVASDECCAAAHGKIDESFGGGRGLQAGLRRSKPLQGWLVRRRRPRQSTRDVKGVDGVRAEDGRTSSGGWGELPFVVLDGLREVLERKKQSCDRTDMIKTARLINRHWRRWASESISILCPWGDLPLLELSNSIMKNFVGVRHLRFERYCGSLEMQLAPVGRLRQLTHLDLGSHALTDDDL